MATRSQQTTVGTTAVQITGTEGRSSRNRTQTILIRTTGDIWLGGSNVSVNNGFSLHPDETLSLDSEDAVYAVANANVTVQVLQVGVA
jgi:hypothetical protein